MRDGRRKRLGLAEGTENPNDGLSYLDNILSDADVAEQSNILNLDTDANVRTTDQDYVSDAYNYYSNAGLNDVTEGVDLDTSQVPGAIDTLVNVNEGQDQATSGLDLGGNTDFEQSLLAPGEIPVTQQEMDDFNALPVTQPSFDDQFQSIEDIGTPIDIGFGEGQVDPGLAAGLEGPIIDTSPVTPTITAPSGDIFAANDPLAAEKIDFAPEQQGIIDQAFSKVGSTAENIMDDLSKIPGAVANFANQTVDIFGKKINVGSTLLKAGINRIVGGPISLVFDALGALGLEGGRSDMSDALGEQYGMDDIGRLTGGPMAGYSVDSAFGDIGQSAQDRIDTIQDTITRLGSTPEREQKIDELEGFIEQVNAYETGAPQEDIGATDTMQDLAIATGIQSADDDLGSEMLDTSTPFDDLEEIGTDADYIGYTEQEKADIAAGRKEPQLGELVDFAIDTTIGPPEDISLIDAAANYQIQPTNVDQGGGGGSTVDSSGNVTDSSGQSQGNINDEFSQPESKPQQSGPTYSGMGSIGSGGGGGDSNGGKSIICTAMYQTTGLEDWSKAMKIWYIYQKKYLTIQHQEGYHKLFKPFVTGMHKNNLIKAIGAHVAKHRTQHLKHVMFNSKPSLLGRIYNKILEPLCYLVGKHG